MSNFLQSYGSGNGNVLSDIFGKPTSDLSGSISDPNIPAKEKWPQVISFAAVVAGVCFIAKHASRYIIR